MYLGMPFANLSTALHFDYSGYTPLCVYGPLILVIHTVLCLTIFGHFRHGSDPYLFFHFGAIFYDYELFNP
jgi:hypothetical protein